MAVKMLKLEWDLSRQNREEGHFRNNSLCEKQDLLWKLVLAKKQGSTSQATMTPEPRGVCATVSDSRQPVCVLSYGANLERLRDGEICLTFSSNESTKDSIWSDLFLLIQLFRRQ